MLWLLRYILGYLLIEIYGDESEQILNRAAITDINIWNTYYKNGRIYGNIAVKNFCKLFKLRHGINCKICIVRKQGLYFCIKNYKKRLGFLIGIASFVIILITLSNFVWVINFCGNDTIASHELINACNKIGIKEGIKKKKINNKYDAQKLQMAQGKIAWCSLNIEGCVLTVNISEVKQSDESNRKAPTNIKSKTYGKIKKINVTSGDVLVKVGDYVSNGDLLVSGILQNNAGLHFVHSEAEIIAETERVFSADGRYVQTLLKPSNKLKTHHTINFFNIKLPLFLGNVKGEYEYKNNVKKINLFNKRIPIDIVTQQYEMLHKEEVTYDKKTLEKILYDDIQKQILDYNFINFTEKSSEIITTETGLLLKITYICEENIAVQDKILLSKEN